VAAAAVVVVAAAAAAVVFEVVTILPSRQNMLHTYVDLRD
jgi:hypothetical protein